MSRDSCRSCGDLWDIPLVPDPADTSRWARVEKVQLVRKLCGYCADEVVRSQDNIVWNRQHRPTRHPGRQGWIRRLFNL